MPYLEGQYFPYDIKMYCMDNETATAWAEKFSHCSSSNDHLLLLKKKKKKVAIKMPACSLQKTTI